jgi:hypothetical protein
MTTMMTMMMSANLVLAATLLGSAAGVAAQEPAKPAAAAPAAAAVVPDTPAGNALKEFIASFNAGGDKRRAWVEERTTIGKDDAAGILQQDGQFLEEHGAMTVVRVASATASNIVAIVKHAKTGAHGHLTLDVDAAAPHKITNMQLRGATPEEIKGGL